jgi:hypothetical protein
VERDREPITVPLVGGLGNQLFQLAAGIVAAERPARAVRYSDYWLSHPAPDETPRRYMLGDLLLPSERTSDRVRREGRARDRLTGRACVERGVTDDALSRVGGRTRLLVGYFQRLSYVAEAWPGLSRRLEGSTTGARRLLEVEQANYGAIHYRLGDYATDDASSRVHGALGVRYFVSAMAQGLHEHDLRAWRLVSDDPVTAHRLLREHGLPSEIELRSDPGTDEWADLGVLAAARLCVISNSSFSWWAAFIGSRLRTTSVVYPQPWFLSADLPDPLLFDAAWQPRPRSILVP